MKKTHTSKLVSKPKRSEEVMPKDAQDLLIVKYGIPDLAKKKKKSKLTTSEGTEIATDEEVYFSIRKPGLSNLTVKVEAYFANVTVNGSSKLSLNVYPSSPVTTYFTVPPSSGYFDGEESIPLEEDWTTVTFQLDGEEFEDEEVGNTLLVILIRGTAGTSPSQTVYSAALIYSVLSPYSVTRKKKKSSSKKSKKA